MASFLLEVGTEELPASFIVDALRQWQERIPKNLDEHQLTTSKVSVYGTPRRLAVLIEGLPTQQSDRSLEIKGPAVGSAFVNGDPQGEPTKALLGFAKSKSIDLQNIVIKETDKGAFVFANQQIIGRETADILQELAPTWITGLEGKRLMRWGHGDLKFPRPIRWLVSLFNSKLLPIALENVQSDRLSQGHRVLHPRSVVIDTAKDYVETLREAFVLVDGKERQKHILTQIHSIVELFGGKAEISEDLLEEVTYLVEFPTAVIGEFEREFLELPQPVIKTEMVSHQRYFPVHSSKNPDQLLPRFITISNGDPDKSRLIAAGNGRVIRARLSDGKFFYDSDRAVHLETFLPLLEKVTFQAQLGSVAEKVDRIRAIAKSVSASIANLEITEADHALIDRTAQLAKADLVTQMVKEFPELQGQMGYYYALSSNEPVAVATGIREHYQPKGACDTLPTTLTGQIIAISDRIDTLVGIFGLGIVPTGSSDPFALRRAATGVVQIAWESGFALDLPKLLQEAIAIYAEKNLLAQPAETVLENLYKWFKQRYETILADQGIEYDLVNAVSGTEDLAYTLQGLSNLTRIKERAHFLQKSRDGATLSAIYEPIVRASRLAVQGDLDSVTVDVKAVIKPETLTEPAEQDLYQAIAALPSQPSDEQLMEGIKAIAPILAKFFDDVLVMAEDPQVRQNRLNLLGIIRNYSRKLADFSAILK
ncbi:MULTISPECIES: glycine--tRNA ligase subunit beta [Pseudanabaena]|jgi:glycyl-tRNA synthetase beta chain|uniref:glycine--tRNA ligase subunit beta n=1 Tax=Pseudanabaena TaxID=1152 RepID=UPI00247A5B5A|nr:MULTISPECIES: glycine--tRNA ligase subunit beta [Pseudanabaena]MEA5487887.1 glycine--tRNA ligase subunit beta [Pseudanabaena sp. CCNP1317]WGS72191.1 glycine--tRNA ligase subunit beta [Pseudanabaena galeata CCNP1313]